MKTNSWLQFSIYSIELEVTSNIKINLMWVKYKQIDLLESYTLKIILTLDYQLPTNLSINLIRYTFYF